ncbi:uncharacterized protein CANTADRAFT_299275 [Suhomyces tanzawaensis NRRL Y-17324]|uniref:Uncharacterized protein n=1 Tax=Suhomyces tanzawaensis NRRL Y-17324 TaxID=984487 RepID=A0A1E4SFA4_9ASCO|nr:uncharacterized protein CANTADRAFT_299275 [Suhomyces tanzawaensis NRRL Y-17324]ODV78207.1 hypothetical protein CANTADRAFT_299275 [Suhomyces tanzawaensis NRRL Y-17324]
MQTRIQSAQYAYHILRWLYCLLLALNFLDSKILISQPHLFHFCNNFTIFTKKTMKTRYTISYLLKLQHNSKIRLHCPELFQKRRSISQHKHFHHRTRNTAPRLAFHPNEVHVIPEGSRIVRVDPGMPIPYGAIPLLFLGYPGAARVFVYNPVGAPTHLNQLEKAQEEQKQLFRNKENIPLQTWPGSETFPEYNCGFYGTEPQVAIDLTSLGYDKRKNEDRSPGETERIQENQSDASNSQSTWSSSDIQIQLPLVY